MLRSRNVRVAEESTHAEYGILKQPEDTPASNVHEGFSSDWARDHITNATKQTLERAKGTFPIDIYLLSGNHVWNLPINSSTVLLFFKKILKYKLENVKFTTGTAGLVNASDFIADYEKKCPMFSTTVTYQPPPQPPQPPPQRPPRGAPPDLQCLLARR